MAQGKTVIQRYALAHRVMSWHRVMLWNWGDPSQSDAKTHHRLWGSGSFALFLDVIVCNRCFVSWWSTERTSMPRSLWLPIVRRCIGSAWQMIM